MRIRETHILVRPSDLALHQWQAVLSHIPSRTIESTATNSKSKRGLSGKWRFSDLLRTSLKCLILFICILIDGRNVARSLRAGLPRDAAKRRDRQASQFQKAWRELFEYKMTKYLRSDRSTCSYSPSNQVWIFHSLNKKQRKSELIRDTTQPWLLTVFETLLTIHALSIPP